MKPILAQANSIHIPLADESVHCVITSVPYYRQRKYQCACDWPAVSFRPSPHLDAVWQVEPWSGELGWEPHPLDFVGHLVLVYRDVFRVLRKDGQCWLNIGDKRTKDRQWHSVPEMLLSALVAEGWRHEDTVIWRKGSCMPGSQTNRFTRDFEKVYLLNKNKRAYLDLDAVREPQVEATLRRKDERRVGAKYTEHSNNPGGIAEYPKRLRALPGGRTRRTVWTVNPKGTNLDHYAAFPVDLVTPMIRCSISERGCCPICKAPWVRVVEISGETNRQKANRLGFSEKNPVAQGVNCAGGHGDGSNRKRTTIAWHPSCTCQGSPSRGPVTCGKCGGTGKEKVHSQSAMDAEGGRVGIDAAPGGDGRPLAGLNTRRSERKETGNPCPACSGTGTVTGDIWPDDVDTWEVAPSTVLDMCCGTGTVGEALASLQSQHTDAGTIRYPGVFVGLDLKLSYLADLSRERLQIEALEQWTKAEGKDGGDWASAVAELTEKQGGNGHERQLTLVEV